MPLKSSCNSLENKHSVDIEIFEIKLRIYIQKIELEQELLDVYKKSQNKKSNPCKTQIYDDTFHSKKFITNVKAKITSISNFMQDRNDFSNFAV